MRRFGIVGLLLGLLLLGGVAAGAYQLGITAGATTAAVEAGATVVVPAHWGVGGLGGFPVFGFFFGFLFLVLVIGFVGRLAFGRGPGPMGPMGGPGPWVWGGRGPWRAGDGTPPPHVDAWLRGWHDQVHGAPGMPSSGGPTSASGTTGGPATTAGPRSA